jgi:hypothetical protein
MGWYDWNPFREKGILGGLNPGSSTFIANPVIDTAQAILKNPLPMIETLALTAVGVPYPLAAAAVSAVNGGSIQDMALAGVKAYVAGEIGKGAGDYFAPNEFQTIDPQYSAAQLTQQIVTSASSQAALAAINGGSFKDILAAGASGAIYNYTLESLKEQGINPKDLSSSVITNAVSAATKSLIDGKMSVADAIAKSATSAALSNQIQSGVDYLQKNTELGQSLAKQFNSAKQSAMDLFNNQIKPLQDQDAQIRAEAQPAMDAYNNAYDQVKYQADSINAMNRIYSSTTGSQQDLNDIKQYIDPYGDYRWDGSQWQKYVQDYDFTRPNDFTSWGPVGEKRIDPEFRKLLGGWIQGDSESLQRYGIPLLNERAADLQPYADKLTQVQSQLSTPAAQYQDYINQLNSFKTQSDEINSGMEAKAKEIGAWVPQLQESIGATLAEIVGKEAAGEVADIVEPPPDTGTPDTGIPGTGPVGPMTADEIKRYNDEFARYLDSLQPGASPPPDYGVQDLGITPENWQSFDKNLLAMQEAGQLPTQWKAGQNGQFTYTDDDGSTLTLDASGNIIGHTEAPPGNLPGETPPGGTTTGNTTIPKIPVGGTTTSTTTTGTTTGGTTTGGTTGTTPGAVVPGIPTGGTSGTSGMDLAGLMALLGAAGGSQPSAPPPTVDIGQQLDLEADLQTNPFAKQQTQSKMASGGSIDDLLALLQQRG